MKNTNTDHTNNQKQQKSNPNYATRSNKNDETRKSQATGSENQPQNDPYSEEE